ncbi:hypothetical protein [Roseovarius ramblicola]|uniref:Uncharacterized protein n=1 Tax=Roseovarius ramblicola TaxID=2022336 RepID=A0ABV5HYR7_9RHOB
MLMVETIGTIPVMGSEERPRVVITGPREDVRKLGSLLGENVEVLRRRDAKSVKAASENLAAAESALISGVLVQRRYLRSLIELGCRGRDGALEVNADNPPWPQSLDSSSRPYVAGALTAIREAEEVLRQMGGGDGWRDDDSPAWLDQVIDGEIEI